jgi:hypothetical protein
LYKEKNSLIEKWSRAKLDVQHEQNAPEKAILQEMVDFYKAQLAELDKNYIRGPIQTGFTFALTNSKCSDKIFPWKCDFPKFIAKNRM